jgi:hypothetical protein
MLMHANEPTQPQHRNKRENQSDLGGTHTGAHTARTYATACWLTISVSKVV